MKVPVVTEDIVIAVSDELARNGVNHLLIGIEAIQIEQPHLSEIMNRYIDKFVTVHGTLAAESALRLLVMQYKFIETQFEVNDLEEQGKL